MEYQTNSRWVFRGEPPADLWFWDQSQGESETVWMIVSAEGKLIVQGPSQEDCIHQMQEKGLLDAP